jgi:hypothetical protein
MTPQRPCSKQPLLPEHQAAAVAERQLSQGRAVHTCGAVRDLGLADAEAALADHCRLPEQARGARLVSEEVGPEQARGARR